MLHETDEAFALPQVEYDARELVIAAVGNKVQTAHEVVEELRERGVDAGWINLRCLKPLPEQFLAERFARVRRVATLEGAVLDGGVGSALATLIADRGLACEVLRIGLRCTFVEPGSSAELSRIHRLDRPGVLERLAARWPEVA